MTMQNRDPKGTSTGGQFAADVNPESTVMLVNVPSAGRDETRREMDDAQIEEFAEEANTNFDNWLDRKADEGEDWNEWTMADALSMMETFEAMIRARKIALQNDVRNAETRKIAQARVAAE